MYALRSFFHFLKVEGYVAQDVAQTLPLSMTLIEDSDPTMFGYTREEVNAWALRSLEKRLKVIGVPFLLG